MAEERAAELALTMRRASSGEADIFVRSRGGFAPILAFKGDVLTKNRG